MDNGLIRILPSYGFRKKYSTSAILFSKDSLTDKDVTEEIIWYNWFFYIEVGLDPMGMMGFFGL